MKDFSKESMGVMSEGKMVYPDLAMGLADYQRGNDYTEIQMKSAKSDAAKIKAQMPNKYGQ